MPSKPNLTAALPTAQLVGIETIGLVTPKTFARIAHPDLPTCASYPEGEDSRQALVSLSRLRSWLTEGVNPYQYVSWGLDESADAAALMVAGLLDYNATWGTYFPTSAAAAMLRRIQSALGETRPSHRRAQAENYAEGL